MLLHVRYEFIYNKRSLVLPENTSTLHRPVLPALTLAQHYYTSPVSVMLYVLTSSTDVIEQRRHQDHERRRPKRYLHTH